ncbi:MAG: leucyl aminopeptidase [Gammaproteobacteria bacterium]
MQINVKSLDPATDKSDCYIAAVLEDGKLSSAAKQLDKLSKGHISRIIKQGDISGKLNQILLLHDVPGIASSRVLLVGVGKEALSDNQYRTLLRNVVQRLLDVNLKRAICALAEADVKERDTVSKIQLGSETISHALYRYGQTKSEKTPAPSLRQVSWQLDDQKQHKAASHAAKTGQAIANGMALTRELGNLPGNICTPSYLASQAKKLGKSHGLKVSVLDQKRIEELKMGSFLSVARGSRQPPRLIVMEHHGGKKTDHPVVLVGKGITFDSGGISIKPGAAMDEMKFDMCGAATVFGTLQAIAELKLPINVVGVVPTCENLPDGAAIKPGDIVTSMSGQTIEILNTDAEGRLILCDALTYSEKFKPRAVIDIATLTGACIIALGHQASGLLGNDQALVDKLLNAAGKSDDRAWQLPLWEEYQDLLKSNFADMANIGGREAGTITAACFLSRFTKKYKWAHLDIAGVAWDSGANKGATGRPVPLLVNYLLGEAGKG